MWTNRLTEHPNDEMLLAYLDGEVSVSRVRLIRNHLKTCWKCRSILADLESQAEAISRMLTENSDSDIDQAVVAKKRFLQWRASFERQRKTLLRSASPLLLNHAALCLCGS
jgi:anti-sigma factor RsiW